MEVIMQAQQHWEALWSLVVYSLTATGVGRLSGIQRPVLDV
jgi:hypothetical protein